MLRRQDLAGCAFLLIHGSSGVGKSSLARAGLLADLEETAGADDRWRSAIVLPSRGKGAPLAALAAAVTAALPDLPVDASALRLRMRDDPTGAADAIAASLTQQGAAGRLRLALLVDQLEELLLWAREAASPDAARERDAFAATLARLARTRLVWVIATLRSDLITLLEDSPVLSDLARNERLYRLGRPRAGALNEIIRAPAALAGIRFVGNDKDDLPLADVLTDAARRQQDCLPLLQFTLQLLYDDDAAEPGTISYARYESIGGLEDAIGTWADRTVMALDADHEIDTAVDDVIFNLARRGRDTDIVVAAEFAPDEAFLTAARLRVIAALEKARLIVSDADPKTQRRTIRVAHEALLTHWRRARALFETHGAKLALKDDLERSAIRWRDQNRGAAFLILGAAPLAEAAALRDDGRVSISELARGYIDASLAAQQIAVEGIKARLARDEQKIADLVAASTLGEAAGELERVLGYLAETTDPALRDRRAELVAQHGRIARLARYDAAARTVFPLAGQEDLDHARSACEAALLALDVLSDPDWRDNLPTGDLSAEQVAEMLQDIYRISLLYSGLQIVPALRILFPGRPSSGPRPARGWDPKALYASCPCP